MVFWPTGGLPQKKYFSLWKLKFLFSYVPPHPFSRTIFLSLLYTYQDCGLPSRNFQNRNYPLPATFVNVECQSDSKNLQINLSYFYLCHIYDILLKCNGVGDSILSRSNRHFKNIDAFILSNLIARAGALSRCLVIT